MKKHFQHCRSLWSKKVKLIGVSARCWRSGAEFKDFIHSEIDLHVFILIRAYNSLLQQRWKWFAFNSTLFNILVNNIRYSQSIVCINSNFIWFPFSTLHLLNIPYAFKSFSHLKMFYIHSTISVSRIEHYVTSPFFLRIQSNF